ncbi:hypothetical protein [Bacillus atrophaeus]|uniref:hypothetical protein n=1 Tax=Bacillus atrophaeus TaxID=1452 RepID=UPI00039C0B19|nr:hypothetical protein [Bacillus atrophaeus]
MSKCALCGEERELEKSHIIPKFVFRSMKKNSPTGNMRMASQPNRVIQDGDKQAMLCGVCEDRFSQNETIFANKVYHPYHSDNLQVVEYGLWLNYFITSVSWRSLYLDIIGFVSEQNIDIKELDTLIEAEQIMREFLLGKRIDLGHIENHIFFFGPIKEVAGDTSEFELHTAIGGSVVGYTYISHDFDSSYVFLNLQGILIVTILKKAVEEVWKNTLVGENGTFNMEKPNHSVSSPVFNELFALANDLKESRQKISESQKEKIVEGIKKNPERFLKSKAYQRLKDDERIRKN